MANSLDGHKLPDQLPIKGHDEQYVIAYPLGGVLHTNTGDLPIQYEENGIDHYSDAEKHWIAGAIKHPGALTKKAKAAGESPMAFARSHADAGGKTGKQARLALTLSKMHKGK